MSWELLVDRAVALAEGGDPDAAVLIALQAVVATEDLGTGPRSRALVTLGYAQTLSGELVDGRASLREAIASADPDDHATLADGWHHLGVALQLGEDLQEAERCLRQALYHREVAWGADHPYLAKSWGDLARIAFQRGGRGAGVSSLLLRGQGILERAMVAPSASFDLGELRYDAYTIASNLILVRIEDARWDEAIRAARAAVDHLEAYVGLGREVPDGVANRLEGYFTLLEAAGERGARDLRTRLERLVPSELVPDTDDDIDLGDWE